MPLQCQSEPGCFAFCGMPFGRYRHQRIAPEPSEVSPFCDKSRLTFTCCSRLYAPQRPAARSARSGIPGKALQAGHYRLCRPVWPGLARRYLLVFWPGDICSLSLSRVVGLLAQRLLYGLSCYSPDVIGAHAQSGWLVAVFFISASS